MVVFKIIGCIVIFSIFYSSPINAASLAANQNKTTEIAMLKTTTAISEIFEDITWFFERLGIFCDMVEKMIPTEKNDREQNKFSVGLNFQTGLRHFLYGVREISRSIVRVLSDKEVREYQQLSRATDFAHDIIENIGHFFRDLRIVIGDLFTTYTFYIPEVMLTKCMGHYIQQSYPQRSLYEYPILLINDVIDSFRTISNDTKDIKNYTASTRMLGLGAEIHYDKNVEQNEILDEDLYVFHNTPVSPSPELSSKTDVSKNKLSVFKNPKENQMEKDEKTQIKPDWKKCIQIYATETIFRKIEFYFLE